MDLRPIPLTTYALTKAGEEMRVAACRYPLKEPATHSATVEEAEEEAFANIATGAPHNAVWMYQEGLTKSVQLYRRPGIISLALTLEAYHQHPRYHLSMLEIHKDCTRVPDEDAWYIARLILSGGEVLEEALPEFVYRDARHFYSPL